MISSFGPGQVPPVWQPVLFWFGVALAIFAAVIWPIIGFAMKGGRRFPERHRAILQELAAPLATVQEQATTYGQRDFGKMTAARAQTEELIGQIPYDHETVRMVRDFLQACAIVTHTHNTAAEMREARQDVARVSPALFRYLHDGKSVDRRKIDLPDWMRDGDGKEPGKPRTVSDPAALGARLVENEVKRAESDTRNAELKAERRQQIVVLRDAAVAYGRKPDYAFRGHLERVRAYADIRRHLSADFKAELHQQRMAWVMPQGARYGHLVERLMNELDRLEAEWNL